jgi:hypothetical protein
MLIGLFVGAGFAFFLLSLHLQLKRLQSIPTTALGAIVIAVWIVDLAWIGAAGFVGSSTRAVFDSVH